MEELLLRRLKMIKKELEKKYEEEQESNRRLENKYREISDEKDEIKTAFDKHVDSQLKFQRELILHLTSKPTKRKDGKNGMIETDSWMN